MSSAFGSAGRWPGARPAGGLTCPPTWSSATSGSTAPIASVADITCVPTWEGFLYLAIVLDAWSRRVVGWSMANHPRTELVLQALDMVLLRRLPRNVIHHSDQGGQPASIEYGKRCRLAAVSPSMGSVGDAYDNAMAESSSPTWSASS